MGCRATWIGRHSPLRSGDYRRRRWLSWSRTGIGWGGQHQRTCVIVPFVADWPTWMRPERPTTLRPNPANLTTVKMIEGVGDVAHCRAESRSQTRARIWTTLMNLRRIHQGLRLHSKERTKRRTAAAAAADATILSARRALTKGARDLPSDWCQVCAPQSRCTRLRSLPNRLSIRYFWVFFFFLVCLTVILLHQVGMKMWLRPRGQVRTECGLVGERRLDPPLAVWVCLCAANSLARVRPSHHPSTKRSNICLPSLLYWLTSSISAKRRDPRRRVTGSSRNEFSRPTRNSLSWKRGKETLVVKSF